jgi:hypothetical protein
MTYALGWVLANSANFLGALGKELNIKSEFSERLILRLQEHHSSKGFTDIEIYDPGRFHIIVEAKRGFTVPGREQLLKYAQRLKISPNKDAIKMLVVLAEDDRAGGWLREQVPHSIKGIPIATISWYRFIKFAYAHSTSSTYAQRHILRQFIQYLERVIVMQRQDSNRVYVVSLSDNKFGCGDTTFVDVVEKFRKYFHPIGGKEGGGWPNEPPNYLAFRYHGKLQSIHHVNSHTIIKNFAPHFTKKSAPLKRPHFLYELGAAIKPIHRIPTNDKRRSIYPSGRKWVYIDLLLTSKSIAEAAFQTKRREAVQNKT